MDEQRILELVRAAVELEEIEAAAEGRTRSARCVKPRRPRRVRLWTAFPLAAAAAALFIVLRTPALTITELAVEQPVMRGEHNEMILRFRLSRPAYTGVIVIDERHERWLMPFEATPEEYFPRLKGNQSIRLPMFAAPDDPRGLAGTMAVLVAAFDHPFAAPETFLNAIPEPIAPAGAGRPVLQSALQKIAGELSSRFDGAAVVVHVDGP